MKQKNTSHIFATILATIAGVSAQLCLINPSIHAQADIIGPFGGAAAALSISVVTFVIVSFLCHAATREKSAL